MKIDISHNIPDLVLSSKRTKYHGSSFIYVNDEFYSQHGAYGGTPEIVTRKLDLTDKKIVADLKKNGVQRHNLSRMSDVDEDYLPFY